MPRFYRQYGRGYDLDLELPFCDVGEDRCILGSAGSFIMVCETCGEEHFRETIHPHESCFQGHGRMVPLTMANREKINSLYSGELTTVEERRADRLERETTHPWDWAFGDKAEADFPLGYVKETS